MIGADFNDQKPIIDYPCQWIYTVIGMEQGLMHQAVAEIVTDTDYSLTLSNTSRTGKYCSLKLEMIVSSEGERNRIYQSLQNHRAIKMVL